MSHYHNPPEQIKDIARPLKTGNFRELTKQLKTGEHLFALAYRGEYPQCIYLHNRSIFGEYKSAVHMQGYIDSYYAMGSKAWDEHFGHVPLPRYRQHGIPEHQEQMIPVEDLFFDKD